ncbi:glycosyltransferase [Rubrivirga marina]|uniref:Glycosyl transferase family 1 n=1 Tax=Rubrivirga marina TaxID=1196024 RepID=A0A271IXH7_9BACT|nr:glycosyltransferase [Rubrivirga marina]PAP75961.1 hypothetical protein BSZ37_05660 [Rubrivirga marina]
MTAPRTALLYSNALLPYSETFIRDHGASLTRYRPVYAGCRRVEGLELDAPVEVLNAGRLDGGANEVRFKMTGHAPAFVERLRAHDPALLHAHFGGCAAVALPLADTLGIPFVVTFHGVDATRTLRDRLRAPTLTSQLYLLREQRLQKRADAVLVVANYMRDLLLARGFPEDKVRVHYLGIDTEAFAPDRSGVPPPLVLFVGRMVEKKGATYLLRAMAKVRADVPEAELVVIGDGPLRASLEREAAALVPGARFLGRRPPAEVREWMNRARVLSVPSIVAKSGDREGLGIVFLEAQSVGTPVVTFPTGGVPEALDDGASGFLVPEKDVEALAARITSLLTDDALWASMSERGIAWVRERFDIRRQARALESLYDELTERQPATAVRASHRPLVASEL